VTTLFLFLFGYLYLLCAAGMKEVAGSHEMLVRQRRNLGPWTAGQLSTLAAFAITVVLWVLPGIVGLVCGDDSELYTLLRNSLPEAVAALIGAGLLFFLPGGSGQRAITWEQAAQIDWGVVLLYGGGFALGDLSQQTGLATAVGQWLAACLPQTDGLGLLIASTLVATLVSEATSNTASANIVVPVVIGMAQTVGADPLEPALGATLGSSLGFMLPVSTPCNAIVYGSGYIPLTRMIRYGLLLDICGVVVIVTLVRTLMPFVR
jgi:sodium-dependent dicarboxylate transporter 2/3/5